MCTARSIRDGLCLDGGPGRPMVLQLPPTEAGAAAAATVTVKTRMAEAGSETGAAAVQPPSLSFATPAGGEILGPKNNTLIKTLFSKIKLTNIHFRKQKRNAQLHPAFRKVQRRRPIGIVNEGNLSVSTKFQLVSDSSRCKSTW